ncbi:MAG: hypothetical protein ACK4UO_13115 [Pseudolabrys sp.]
MNHFIIGADDKSARIRALLDFTVPLLLIDDGPLIDSLEIPTRRKVARLDWSKHSFDILKGIDYRRARDFITILDALFPAGENTLTKKNANFVLLKALLNRPTKLERLISLTKDPAVIDAYQKIETILFSPVLRSVLTKPTNFPMNGIVLARINRAELGDFDAFALAAFLIGQFQGQVVVPDLGFYGREMHTALIRQNRLIAAVNFLGELPAKLQQAALTIKDKTAYRTTLEDAERLVVYFPGISKPSHLTEQEPGEYRTTANSS